MIMGQFYTYHQTYFTTENALFCDNLLSVIIREIHISQLPPNRVPNCFKEYFHINSIFFLLKYTSQACYAVTDTQPIQQIHWT